MFRRELLSKLPQALGLGLLSMRSGAQETSGHKTLKIMIKSAWGSDDPTRASFPFVHGLALADAGHEVQIFLTGEATYLMRKATVAQIFAVGWPPLAELQQRPLPNTSRSFLEGRAPGPVGSRKQICKIGAQSGAVRPCSCRSSNGRTESLRNKVSR